METITEKKDFVEVKHVTDRATFLRMKEEQKLIATEGKTHAIAIGMSLAGKAWQDSAPTIVKKYVTRRCDLGCDHQVDNPEYAAYLEKFLAWKAAAPTGRYRFTKKYARCHNIVYSMVRGKTYIEVERTVREDNFPDAHLLRQIAGSYGLDETVIKGALENAR